jgi:hypothetical protein
MTVADTIKSEIIESLSSQLALPYTGTEQDWDIEMADAARIADFLQFYQTHRLSADEKIAVMALILASYDDHLYKNNLHTGSAWQEIAALLKAENTLFAGLISYWSCNDADAADDLFAITPLVRKIA